MYGLEAINAHNGWAMAVTGAVIVMLGLSVLSFIISQLHRLIDVVDGLKEKKPKAIAAQDPSDSIKPQTKPPSLSDPRETMQQFMPLTQNIGQPFELAALFQVFVEHDDPHPHLTIRSLREQGFLVPDGEGLFTWKQT